MKWNEMNEMDKICPQSENRQTDREQTLREFKNWGHSNPLWIVDRGGERANIVMIFLTLNRNVIICSMKFSFLCLGLYYIWILTFPSKAWWRSSVSNFWLNGPMLELRACNFCHLCDHFFASEYAYVWILHHCYAYICLALLKIFCIQSLSYVCYELSYGKWYQNQNFYWLYGIF